MIRKKWLDTVWMNLLLLIFINLILTGILSSFMRDYTILSIVAVGIASILVGLLYGFVFGERMHYRLRLFTGLSFVTLMLMMELIIFWQPGLLSFNMIIPRIVLVLTYFAEIYLLLQAGAVFISWILYKKPLFKERKKKTRLAKKKKVTKKITKKKVKKTVKKKKPVKRKKK